MTSSTLFWGYFVSIVIGGIVIYPLWLLLWYIASPNTKENPLKTKNILAIFQGCIERGLYTSTIVLGRPEGIAVWLAFKALMRIRINENDPRHVPGSSIYLIGTALSVAFGVIGGLIAKHTINL